MQIKDFTKVRERVFINLIQLEIKHLPEVLLDVLFSEEDLGLRESLTAASICDELV